MAIIDESAAIAMLLSVTCPRCYAAPGASCTNKETGYIYHSSHWERLEAARDAAAQAARTAVEQDKARRIVAQAVGELIETLQAEPSLMEPRPVMAVAEVLRAAGADQLAQTVIEAASDAHPEDWAAYSRWELAARAAQRDEDAAREGQV